MTRRRKATTDRVDAAAVLANLAERRATFSEERASHKAAGLLACS